MNLVPFIFNLGLITLLVGCGVSSNRAMGENRERSTPGLGTSGSDRIASQIHREKGSTVISYAQEIARTISRELPPTLYRTIPLMEKDDEGSIRNVTTLNNIGRPTVSCGLGEGFAGIDARMLDCFQKNGEKSIWEGQRFGAAGESTWKLVTLNANREEMWLDGHTGMVWSYLVTRVEGANVFNWCNASGNTQNDTATETIDCGIYELPAGEELCVGSLKPEVGTQIIWRLPTRNDFLQADLNGSRFVLQKENAQGLWTATMRASAPGRNEAWVYNSTEGTLSGANLTSLRQVRCIGPAIR